jgi:hypothetical protein
MRQKLSRNACQMQGVRFWNLSIENMRLPASQRRSRTKAGLDRMEVSVGPEGWDEYPKIPFETSVTELVNLLMPIAPRALNSECAACLWLTRI